MALNPSNGGNLEELVVERVKTAWWMNDLRRCKLFVVHRSFAISPSQHRDTYMLKMRLEAQSRRRRAMHTMSTGAAAGGAGPGDDPMKANSSENAMARMARGELFDEEECLTDDEQLDVLPG